VIIIFIDVKIYYSSHNQLRRYEENAFCTYEEQIPHQQIYILSPFVDGEFLLSQKHRCCVEPPPSLERNGNGDRVDILIFGVRNIVN